jgi:DNA invertase Pin-like site-specific DNA recombinase
MDIDTDDRSPVGKFTLQLFAAIAELERSFMLERTGAGQKAYREASAAGRVGKTRHSKSKKDLAVGRPRRVVDRVRACRLRDEEGLSVRQIARKLGIGLGTAHRLLKVD